MDEQLRKAIKAAYKFYGKWPGRYEKGACPTKGALICRLKNGSIVAMPGAYSQIEEELYYVDCSGGVPVLCDPKGKRIDPETLDPEMVKEIREIIG